MSMIFLETDTSVVRPKSCVVLNKVCSPKSFIDYYLHISRFRFLCAFLVVQNKIFQCYKPKLTDQNPNIRSNFLSCLGYRWLDCSGNLTDVYWWSASVCLAAVLASKYIGLSSSTHLSISTFQAMVRLPALTWLFEWI